MEAFFGRMRFRGGTKTFGKNAPAPIFFRGICQFFGMEVVEETQDVHSVGDLRNFLFWPFLLEPRKKTLLLSISFHYTGCSIGIIILAYHHPYKNWVVKSTTYPKQPGLFSSWTWQQKIRLATIDRMVWKETEDVKRHYFFFGSTFRLKSFFTKYHISL